MQSCSVVEACTCMLIPVCQGLRRVDLPPQLHHALLVSWCGLYPLLLPFLPPHPPPSICPLQHTAPLRLLSVPRRRLIASPSSPRLRCLAVVASPSSPRHRHRRLAVSVAAGAAPHRRRRSPRPVSVVAGAAPRRRCRSPVAAPRRPPSLPPRSVERSGRRCGDGPNKGAHATGPSWQRPLRGGARNRSARNRTRGEEEDDDGRA